MEIGSIVYSTQQGLGILAKSFFDNGIVTRVLIKPHPHYKDNPAWYPAEKRFSIDQLDAFLTGLDTLLIFENPFYEEVAFEAKRRNIRVVLMPMYEFTPYPNYLPDIIICPSELDLQYFKSFKSIFIPVPVRVNWKKREKAHYFIHNAGHGGAKFRNGTPELIMAMHVVSGPAKLLVRMQDDDKKGSLLQGILQRVGEIPKNVEIFEGVEDYNKLWDVGDVFVFPEKFNGLSLPLQEAFASGMLVMAGDRFPMNTWLPRDPLIPVHHYQDDHLAVPFRSAVYSFKQIADAIDYWYDKDISLYSEMGKEWAEQNSWENLKEDYIKALLG